MGKSKAKKPKNALNTSQQENTNDLDTGISTSVCAIDGHNTQGWTEDEIKAYNELLVEREKLEKQRNDLEEKCAKSQTQRALLHENVANIDTMFKPQKSVPGAFKFTGASSCCVDYDATTDCHHEICRRARTEGITDTEMDTIKYYSMRIHTEKSERIRNALRKQRDLELIRVRTEEEEIVAKSSKRLSKKHNMNHNDILKAPVRGPRGRDMNKVARDTEKIVNKIIHQLDDLRSDLQTGKISAEEAQGKLNILDSKLPVVHSKNTSNPGGKHENSTITSQELKARKTSFQSNLRERLLDPQTDSFTQAFSIMDHFLSATKPVELQNAISDLKDVLQLSGPLCEELQTSLNTLGGIFDTPDKLSFPGPDGKQECSSMLDLLEKLKEILHQTGQLPEGANISLTKVFQDCIDLEAEAMVQLNLKAGEKSIGGVELQTALLSIKDQFVAKSPIPPLTSNKLDMKVVQLVDMKDVNELLLKAHQATKANELEAYITSLVISRTQKNPTKYVEKLERLNQVCYTTEASKECSALTTAIANVLGKMRKRVIATDAKQANETAVSSDKTTGHAADLAFDSMTHEMKSSGIMDAVFACKSDSDAARILDTTSETMAKQMQRSIRAAVERCGKEGLWDVFDVYHRKSNFSIEPPMLDKLQSYMASTHNILENRADDGGVLNTVCYLYRLKLCPGMVAALICRALVNIAEASEIGCRRHLKDLASCIHDLPTSSMSAEWIETFQHIAVAMIQLYVAIYVEALALFPTTSALYIAITTVEWLTNSIQLTRSSQASNENVKVLSSFLLVCFSDGGSQHVPSIGSAIDHYRYFCRHERFLCMSTNPCSKHMHFVRMPFKPISPSARKLLSQGVTAQDRRKHDTERTIQEPIHEHIRDAVAEATLPFAEIESHPKPRKTIVSYYPARDSGLLSRDVSTGDDGQQVAHTQGQAEFGESCAKKMALLLQQRLGDYQARNLLPPVELFLALEKALYHAGPDYYHPGIRTSSVKVETASTTSRFSEHLSEGVHPATSTIEGVLRLQNAFKRFRIGNAPEGYLQSFANKLQNDALSGRYAIPLHAVTRYAESLGKFATMPRELRETFRKTAEAVERFLSLPTNSFLWETRRLKYILGLVDCDIPSTDALGHLASTNMEGFLEYHAIVLARLKETPGAEAKAVEFEAFIDEHAEEVSNPEEDATVFGQFMDLVMDDWNKRTQETEVQDVHPNEDRVESVTMTNNSKTTSGIMNHVQDPAVVASDGSVLPLGRDSTAETKCHGSQDAIVMLGHTNDNCSPPERAHTLVDHHRDTKSIKPPVAFQQRSPTDYTHQPSIDQYCTTRSDGSAELHGSGTPEIQYLLPTNGVVDSSESKALDEDAQMSTPVSFRMLDMMKHMTALQRNARDLLQTAQHVTTINKDHGKLIHNLAEKVALQVNDYADFVQEIAGWNGVELAKEGLSLT